MSYRIKRSMIFMVMLLAVTGCGGKKEQESQETIRPTQEESRQPQEESRQPQEPQRPEPEAQSTAEEQNAGQDWDSLVSEAILSENQGRYTGEECVAEGHRILDMEEDGTETKIYALTMYGEYQFQNGNFVKGSGSGVIPAVFVFQKDSGGAYKLSFYEVPEDGSGYAESIEKMFPEELWEICISPTEEVCAELESQEKGYASEYLKALGRTAKIGSYRDFEHPLLTDAGISVEASNRLMENKDISNYPYEIGNVEVLEDGVRYVYQTDYEPEKERILLTKTEYDSGKVKEVYIFDSETGEPDVNAFPGVNMKLLEVSKTDIRVEFLNTTDLEVEFGEAYALQKFTDGEWVSVPYRIDNWAFHEIAYIMTKDKPVEWETDWESFHGALEPGYYRMVKTVMDFRGTGDYMEYELAVGFEIGE